MNTAEWEKPETARRRMDASIRTPKLRGEDPGSSNAFDLWRASKDGRAGMGFGAFVIAYGFDKPESEKRKDVARVLAKTEPTVDELLAEAARLAEAGNLHALEAGRYSRDKGDRLAAVHAIKSNELKMAAEVLRRKAAKMSPGVSS